jgi:small GTP-binding protein
MEETNEMSEITAEPANSLYKVVVLGDIQTGKSSFIRTLVHDIYTCQYKATIGVDFALHKCPAGYLQLWDIAGQERYGNMTRVYYKQTCAVVVVYDVTRLFSRDGAEKWISDAREKLDERLGTKDSTTPLLIVANKSDLLTSPDCIRAVELELEQLGTKYHAKTLLFSCANRNSTPEGVPENSLPSHFLRNLPEGVPENSLPSHFLRKLPEGVSVACETARSAMIELVRTAKPHVNSKTNPAIPSSPETVKVAVPVPAPLPEPSQWQFLIWKELVLSAVKSHFGDKTKIFSWDPNLIVNLPFVHTATEEQITALAREAQNAIPTAVSRAIRELISEESKGLHKVAATRINDASDLASAGGLTWFHFY